MYLHIFVYIFVIYIQFVQHCVCYDVVLFQTPTAASKIKEIMEERTDMKGLRISVRTRGCSGNAFHLEYASEKEKFDEEIDAYGTKVWVDTKALLKIMVCCERRVSVAL